MTVTEIKEAEKTKVDQWLDKASPKWFDDRGTIRAPRDYLDNLRYRAWLGDITHPGIDDDCRIRQKILKQCKNDIHFFFNTYSWTYDPRKEISDLPFITYDYEDRYIDWVVDHIKKKKDCFTEKSRDMGMSWTLMGVILHGWMFNPGFLAHLGSKKEDDVDRSGDMRSLFEKIRYMLRQVPSWLRPYQFNWKKHSMQMRLINPYNNNTITGESSNRDFGRAGRYSCVVLDEFAFMEYGEEAWTATGDSTPCRIAVSTPNGTGNKFWQLRFKSNIDRFTAHWTLHPDKTEGVYLLTTKQPLTKQEANQQWANGAKVSSLWYENECNRRLTEDNESRISIAQEIDMDYLVSGNPFFDINALKKQKEWKETEDWLNFEGKKEFITGILTEIDGRIEFRPNKNGWLKLFEKPVTNGQYVGALDPAAGSKGGDYCAGAFREKKSRNIVATIYGHYDYDELSLYGHLVSRFFNGCLVCSEAGGYGAAVNKRLYDLGANVARTVDLSSGSLVERDKLGFVTNTRTRPQLLGDLEAEIREGACELRDRDLINECMNFVVKDGKPQAAEGSNDDLIFATGIAGQLIKINPYSRELERKGRRIFFFKKPLPNQGIRFKK